MKSGAGSEENTGVYWRPQGGAYAPDRISYQPVLSAILCACQ